MTADNMHALPDGLPVPTDDGACDHLPGLTLPSIPLRSTDGSDVDLAVRSGRTVVYIDPRTGRPEERASDRSNAMAGVVYGLNTLEWPREHRVLVLPA